MKFIADSMLGRLAKWLRILGYDTVYFKSGSDSELVFESIRQGRIILTGDRNISRNVPLRIIFVKSDCYTEQLMQIIKELNLKPEQNNFFKRCSVCNCLLNNISREKIKRLVPEYVYETQTEFSNCPECGRIYWRGTHTDRIFELLKRICV
ncbi:MAG: hypothetical protein BWY26_00184 [Elusimicrobia bacterium ADurb.Bin231]|nr:MAG: hypothetical protein BWY26_00184 [Elusimicrobia bacterium ADurb.Bin231]